MRRCPPRMQALLGFSPHPYGLIQTPSRAQGLRKRQRISGRPDANAPACKTSCPRLPHRILSRPVLPRAGLFGPVRRRALRMRRCPPRMQTLLGFSPPSIRAYPNALRARKASENAIEFPIVPMQTPHARKISRPRLPHRVLSSLRPHVQGFLGLSGNGPCGCGAVLRACKPFWGVSHPYGLIQTPHERKASWDGRSRHAVAGANASARKASRRRERQPRRRALTGARVACPNPGLRSILHPAQ